MLMLMLLELIYFVFVFRMLLPFYFFHTRKVSERDHAQLIPSLRCDLCRRKVVCIIRAVTTSREKWQQRCQIEMKEILYTTSLVFSPSSFKR